MTWTVTSWLLAMTWWTLCGHAAASSWFSLPDAIAEPTGLDTGLSDWASLDLDFDLKVSVPQPSRLPSKQTVSCDGGMAVLGEVFRLLPDSLYSPHSFCRLALGPQSRLCGEYYWGRPDRVCDRLWCLDVRSRACVAVTSALGLQCGPSKWCMNGQCQYFPELPYLNEISGEPENSTTPTSPEPTKTSSLPTSSLPTTPPPRSSPSTQSEVLSTTSPGMTSEVTQKPVTSSATATPPVNLTSTTPDLGQNDVTATSASADATESTTAEGATSLPASSTSPGGGQGSRGSQEASDTGASTGSDSQVALGAGLGAALVVVVVAVGVGLVVKLLCRRSSHSLTLSPTTQQPPSNTSVFTEQGSEAGSLRGARAWRPHYVTDTLSGGVSNPIYVTEGP